MKKLILSICLILFCISSYAQKKAWFDSEHRNEKWPSSIYYKEYATGDSKSKALELAKINLSKSIITEVSSKNTFKSVTKNSVYNDIFKESATTESSLSITGLEEKVSKYKKRFHVLIFIKKEDLKAHTKTKYTDLLNTIISDITACERMFLDNSIKGAKTKGDAIEIEKRKLKRLKNLLTVFDVPHDARRFDEDVIEVFEPLYAKIKKQISDEEDYKYNKDQGDLKSMSSHDYELEEAIQFYTKAQKINPKLALEDELPTSIKEINSTLFKKYCQKALNLEEESKYHDAVNFYRKARNLFPGSKVFNEKETTTERIMICQDKLIDIHIEQGIEEFDDNPNTALTNFKKAKNLIISMNRNDRIKEINKLIRKAEKEIKKRKKKEEKTSRNGNIKIQRDKSPHRLLFSVGGGFQNEYTNHNDIFSNPINVDVDKWHISSTLGYRLNLPTEITTSKTGFEKSKGNVLALFYKQGNTVTSFDNNDFESTFQELEFGYIFKEKIRVSLGKGTRFIHMDYIDMVPSNYNCATGSWYMHFGRLSVETSVTYLLDEKLAFEQAKLNANFSLRFYLWKKIYKTVKDKIQ